MLDRDLAELYGVTTGNLNKAVKRNIERFPERFMFQLTEQEFLYSKMEHQVGAAHENVLMLLPNKGISMLSAVLRSPTAIQVSIRIMDAFVAMRQLHYDDFDHHGRTVRIRAKLTLLSGPTRTTPRR